MEPRRPPRLKQTRILPIDNGDLDMQVVFDPETGDTDYRPVVPYGTSWKAYVEFLSANGPYVCTRLDFGQDEVLWFSTGWGDHLSFEKSGVTCQIDNFTQAGLTLRIENKNLTRLTIVVQVTPQFSDGQQIWTGADPQIVLPPEK